MDPRRGAPAVQVVADEDPLLTVAEIAGLLRVSKMSVHRAIDAGELRSVRIRRSIRIRRSWLAAYLRDHSTAR